MSNLLRKTLKQLGATLFGNKIQKTLLFIICLLLARPALADSGTVVLWGVVGGILGAAVGGISHAAKTARWKNEIISENAQRVADGLPELDQCTAMYKKNKHWAKRNRDCKDRVIRYEAGDKTALFNSPETALPQSKPSKNAPSIRKKTPNSSIVPKN